MLPKSGPQTKRDRPNVDPGHRQQLLPRLQRERRPQRGPISTLTTTEILEVQDGQIVSGQVIFDPERTRTANAQNQPVRSLRDAPNQRILFN
jgi:hypothetical protein